VKDHLFAAEGDAQKGHWSSSANSLNAALMTIGSMSGVCRELNLIYLLTEE